jgi:CRP-like cAMP-binding protein
MTMENLEHTLREHPFLAGLPDAQVASVSDCGAFRQFDPGEFLLLEGQAQGKLFLIREGTVAIEAATPGGPPVIIETVGPGDVLGVSWLTPANNHFDCRARDRVLTFAVDLRCLRTKMEGDASLGYALASRLLDLTYDRLSRLRLSRMDLYR